MMNIRSNGAQRGTKAMTDRDRCDRYVIIYVITLSSGVAALVVGLWMATLHYRGLILPPSPDDTLRLSYYETSITVATDHDVFYESIGPSMDHARKAQVIILGHSQVLFAFHGPLMESFGRRHGVRFFHLGLLSETGGRFYLDIMDRHRLRPQMVIVQLDYAGRPAFLYDEVTVYGKSVMNRGPLERRLSHLMDVHVRWWMGAGEKRPIQRVLYRGETNGFLRADHWSGFGSAGTPIETTGMGCPDVKPEDITLAARLKETFAKWNATMVLTVAPSVVSCPDVSRKIAATIGVPFIAVEDKGMESFDGGYHLNEKGARLFTERFLSNFERLTIFPKIVRDG